MKKYVLLDHDGVLVDTERWYDRAGERALADYERAKPHPEPYLTGLRRLGASAAETLVVEDSHRGLSAAVAAGIDCAVVHHDFTAGQDFSRATHRVDSLAEVVDLVR